MMEGVSSVKNEGINERRKGEKKRDDCFELQSGKKILLLRSRRLFDYIDAQIEMLCVAAIGLAVITRYVHALRACGACKNKLKLILPSARRCCAMCTSPYAGTGMDAAVCCAVHQLLLILRLQPGSYVE